MSTSCVTNLVEISNREWGLKGFILQVKSSSLSTLSSYRHKIAPLLVPYFLMQIQATRTKHRTAHFWKPAQLIRIKLLLIWIKQRKLKTKFYGEHLDLREMNRIMKKNYFMRSLKISIYCKLIKKVVMGSTWSRTWGNKCTATKFWLEYLVE